jgi:hypothetical protein
MIYNDRIKSVLPLIKEDPPVFRHDIILSGAYCLVGYQPISNFQKRIQGGSTANTDGYTWDTKKKNLKGYQYVDPLRINLRMI